MKWTQIKVNCKPSQLESVCAVMSMIDSKLMIEDFSDVVECNPVYGELIDEQLLQRRDEASVSIYVSEENAPDTCMEFLKDRFAQLGESYEIEAIVTDEEDWADNWKQYYKPIKIGQKLVIVPEWEKEGYIPEKNEVVVIMDPGMAFGTGTHETTRLCAGLLEKYMPANGKSKILDIGTGSGILAICASKLGAGQVDAYDIDPMAVRVAKENITLNNCPNIRCGESDLLSAVRGVYDFAVANITADIIIRMAPQVGNYLKKGGGVALSGIIEWQCENVKNAMRAGGFILADEIRENDWCGVYLTKI